MSFLPYSLSRLRSFIGQVDSLAESEFPYADSKAALVSVRTLFEKRLAQLEHFDDKSHEPVVKQECRLALEALFSYLPLLGFILRSTNVRNAFEAFAPIRRLATALLVHSASSKPTPAIHLLLSSEWDYSPFVYDAIPGLPDFLMIGLPAPESSNPLLLPLAGHELGHSLWRARKLAPVLQPVVKAMVIHTIQTRWKHYKELFLTTGSQDDLITNLLELENWAPAADWALAQAEETFCDFVGLLLFGTSFLHAFAYLLSPAFGRRTMTYPPLQQRAVNLAWAANQHAIKSPDSYAQFFDAETFPTLSKRDQFLLAVADDSLFALREALLERANALIKEAKLTLPSTEQVAKVYKDFERVVPAEGAASVVAILNASWLAFHNSDLWKDLPEVFRQRDIVLRDLTLKSLEIFEFEYLTRPLP